MGALPDAPATIVVNPGDFIRVSLHLAAAAVEDVPIPGGAQDRNISTRIIRDILTIDAIHEVSVFIGQIPGPAPLYPVSSVIE